jgi:hypothetical protein
VDGFVDDSRITGNGYGILLTDSGTVTASGDILTGNGYAAYNANADNSAVRSGSPFTVTRSYFGTKTPVVSGEGSVVVSKPLSSAPHSVPSTVGRVADHDPTAAVADPANGAKLEVGKAVNPLIRGTDDFAVASATLLVNGAKVDTLTAAPYGFSWTPPASYAGKKVTFQALVTDSSGNKTWSRPVTATVAPVTPPPTLKVTKVQLDSRTGTATLTASVNTAGTITLSGDQVVAVTKQVSGGCAVTLTVTAAPEYKQILLETGKLDVDLTVAFQNATGQTATQPLQVTLVKK